MDGGIHPKYSLSQLLVILFLTNLILARTSIFTLIKQKYGQEKVKTVRDLERDRTKLAKVNNDLRFLTTSRKKKLCPKFTLPKLSIKVTRRIQKISHLILRSKINHKHKQRKILEARCKKLTQSVQQKIGPLLMIVVNYKKINDTIKGKAKAWKEHYNRKLENLRKQLTSIKKADRSKLYQKVIHNFSSYQLTEKEKYALSFGLGQHVQGKLDHIRIKTEFEFLYQELARYTNHLSESQQRQLKTKIRNICNNYCGLKSSPQQQYIIKTLFSNKEIVILK